MPRSSSEGHADFGNGTGGVGKQFGGGEEKTTGWASRLISSQDAPAQSKADEVRSRGLGAGDPIPACEHFGFALVAQR
jgi:hypothetical protein